MASGIGISPQSHFHTLRRYGAGLLAASLWLAPLPAIAQSGAHISELRAEIAGQADTDLQAFYRSRDNRPLWVSAEGELSPAADALIDLVRTSELDGINPRKLKARDIVSAIRRAENDPTDAKLARAEVILSRTLAAYVKMMRQARRAPMTYASGDLAPAVPTSQSALIAAASAPSLDRYITTVGWMHPLYGELRRAAVSDTADPEQQAVLVANLERLRAIPASPGPRYVLVDAAGARLWMYENGRAVGSMKVVVGKADNQTPLIAGYLRTAVLNPYWNVPVDLAQSRIAANVLGKGVGYLAAGGYQVMSDWTNNARSIDPTTVDWNAVASGAKEVRVRQLPGRANFMGKVKFEFPNDLGIYLHDTPDKELMGKDGRQFSSGCVRLEDAQRFGRWLLRKPLPSRVRAVERRIALPEAVPVYITYLTAMPANGQVIFNPDPYGRDRSAFALGDGRGRRE
jgi:murein L,D-transpeptidase YcbB/YkuD